MRSKRSYGRPGTRVIPPGWGASHAPVIDGLLTAEVSLTDPATATDQWSDAEQRTIRTSEPYATAVTARIQIVFKDYSEISGEEQLEVADYRVTVPHDHEALPGHQVTVSSCPGDPMLLGRTLAVAEVLRGSERFQRDLMCQLVN